MTISTHTPPAGMDRPPERAGASPAIRRHLRWKGEQLVFGALGVGEVMLWQTEPNLGRWRAWAMTEPGGAHHGWFATEQDAKRQVETVVGAALSTAPR